jgi:hypothetical protein
VTIERTSSSTKRISIRHCQHNERTAHKQRGKRGPTPATLGTQSLAIPKGKKSTNNFLGSDRKRQTNNRRPKLFRTFLLHTLEIPQPGQPRVCYSPFAWGAPARFLRLGWMKAMMGCLRCGGAAAEAANRNAAKTKGPGFDLRGQRAAFMQSGGSGRE